MDLRYFRLPALLAGLLFVFALPASAQVTGISYTVSPVGARVNWDDQAGLSNGYLYGGEVGLGFGEFLELGGIYLLGNNFETDFSELSGDNQAVLDALAALDPRDVKIRRYGAKLRLNLGQGGLVPFATLGTGVLRLDPDGLQESETIYANGGVGVTFSLADRYTLSVAAENLVYRFNAGQTLFSDADLAAVGITRDNFNQQTVYNPAISASAKFYLGGRGAGELTEVDRALLQQFRGGGFRLAVEPFYGQINFSEDLDFPETQAVAGVNAGLDFGPYVGLRGFYWRALEQAEALEDGIVTEFTALEFVGGELDLRFQSQFVRGVTPYVIVGGGYADVGDEYAEFAGVRPESRYFALGGGGVEIPLSRSLKVQGSVRSLIMSTQDIDDVSDPNNVFASWMYAAGINFNLGGGGGRGLSDAIAREDDRRDAEARTEAAAVAAELAKLRARIDSLETARRMGPPPPGAQPGTPRTETVIDTVVVQRDTFAGRTLTIPVPEQGEIYIRFGAPAADADTIFAGPPLPVFLQTDSTMTDSSRAALSALQIQQIVRQALAEREAQQAETRTEDLRDLEQRLENLLERETNRLRDDLAGQGGDVTIIERGDDRGDRAVRDTTGGLRVDDTIVETFRQRELVAIQPIIGIRTGEGPEQFLIGARGDYRFPGRRARALPELALAFGDGVAFSAFGNVAYPFFGGYLDQIQPYAGGGIGFVSDSGLSGLDLAFNLLAGAEYTLPNGLTFFGEYSTLDFFDFHRVLVGYRWRF